MKQSSLRRGVTKLTKMAAHMHMLCVAQVSKKYGFTSLVREVFLWKSPVWACVASLESAAMIPYHL